MYNKEFEKSWKKRLWDHVGLCVLFGMPKLGNTKRYEGRVRLVFSLLVSFFHASLSLFTMNTMFEQSMKELVLQKVLV